MQIDFHYSYRVLWSPEDGEFVGRCSEFPSLSWLATTEGEALHGIITVVREVIKDLEEQGEPIPEPYVDRTFSGRPSLRIPPELHRHLAMEAAEQGISINRLMNLRLGAGN